MKGKSLVDRSKQFGEMVKALISALITIWNDMSTEVAQGWIEDKESLAKVLRKSLILLIDEVSLVDFFQTNPRLWVSQEFREWIVMPALCERDISPVKFSKFFRLPKDMTDEDVRKKLGKDHVFESPQAFLLCLAHELESQWEGEDSRLLSNDFINIFYVRGLNKKVFTVHVHWYLDLYCLNATMLGVTNDRDDLAFYPSF